MSALKVRRGKAKVAKPVSSSIDPNIMPTPTEGETPLSVSGDGSDYCWTCKFFMKSASLCRRYPAVSIRTEFSLNSIFPSMAPWGSCGEHKPLGV